MNLDVNNIDNLIRDLQYITNAHSHYNPQQIRNINNAIRSSMQMLSLYVNQNDIGVNSYQPTLRNIYNSSNRTNQNLHFPNDIFSVANDMFRRMGTQLDISTLGSDVHIEQHNTQNGTRVSISHINRSNDNDNQSSFIDLVLQSAEAIVNQNNYDINDDVGVGEGLCVEYINKLPTAKFSEAKIDGDDENENSLMCTVCQEEYDDDTEILCLPCTHLFHGKCIKSWLENSKDCPNCRTDVEKKIQIDRLF